MNKNETTAPVRAFDRAYINGKFVTPHGTEVVDLVNPTNNSIIGKVTMADEIDTRQAIAAAKEAFNIFSQTSKEYRMGCLQRLHDALARRTDQLVDATVLEYGAPQERAKGSNNLALPSHRRQVNKGFRPSIMYGQADSSYMKEVWETNGPVQIPSRPGAAGRSVPAQASRSPGARARASSYAPMLRESRRVLPSS